MYRVVIVDDEKEISSGFAQYFPWNSLGYSVVNSFSGAREAFEYITKNPVDVVVSDIMMPDMSGVELAQKIYETELIHKPWIVLFTAYEKIEYARQAMHYGCVDYLLKSMEYEELIEAFHKLRERLDEAAVENGHDKEKQGDTLEKNSEKYSERDLERNSKRNSERDSEGNSEGNSDKAEKDYIILTMSKYVEENPVTATLEGAAQAVYLSPSYASRYFKQKTGIGFSEYVLEQKMRLAAELLRQPQYRIYQISEQLGYMNPVNFARAFRRYYKVSPQEYRFQKLGRKEMAEEMKEENER